MYDQIREDTLFILIYGGVTVMALMASFYLLFRRSNAIAPDVTSSIHLRRWTGVFFVTLVLNHIWYMPIFFLSSSEDITMIDLVGGLLDCMTLFPVAIIVLLTMLQDHRRPLWPVAVMMAPIVAAGVFNIASRSYAFLPMAYLYFLLMCIGIIIYMVRALQQYGRWLRDNYADLEHKEVWQSFVVLTIILLVFVIYAFVSQGPAYQYAMQVIVILLICYLLWRVETISDLTENVVEDNCPVQTATYDYIGELLQQHCIDTQLFLQHDLNLSQLAKAIGTNRTYLTNYFIQQNITYNTYINDLRINHFVKLYHEAVASQRPFTAQQLAHDSGYQSYSTFSLAFKQRMGQTVTAWMRDTVR